MGGFPYTFAFDFDTEDITIRIAFDSTPFATTPQWTDISAEVKSCVITRGRQHELDRVEAGECVLVVDNAAGNYWPDNTSGAYYGKLLPGKRINIRKTYGATTYDIFTGFIESFRPRFPYGVATEPEVEIRAVDLFKNLAITELNFQVADVTTADHLYCADNAAISMGDVDFSIGVWVYFDTLAASQAVISKATLSSTFEYELVYNQAASNLSVFISATGDGIGDYAFASVGSIATGTWYFAVVTYNATTNTLSLSVNNGTPFMASYAGGAYDGASAIRIGYAQWSVVGATSHTFDGRIGPVGIWKKCFSAAQITALYNQGRMAHYADLTADMKTSLVTWWDMDEASGNRADSVGSSTLAPNGAGVGSISEYPSERSDVRVGRILDNIGWPTANRDLDVGAATLQALNPVTGVNALSHLQSLQQSENGLIFIQGDGDVEFQNRTARASAPYDTSQATFGEDAGEIGYEDMQPSYDDTFIYNDVRLTRASGTEQVAGDIDSQGTYGKRTLSRTGLLNSTDADVLTVAGLLRDKFKDPSQRIEYIVVDPVVNPSNLWAKVLTYDLSTRITVRLNEASLDSEFHIEGIEHRFGPGQTWKTKWQLSKAS